MKKNKTSFFSKYVAKKVLKYLKTWYEMTNNNFYIHYEIQKTTFEKGNM